MKFKKTTVLGVVLSLALVAGVTAAFASAPKSPAGQSGDPGNNTPYQVCANPLCTVDYQHCHIDGEVVRAYDQYPGLLCAHPDCEIEGPHEHDGVQYAGQAGKYVILNQDAGPVASGAPDEDSTTSSAPADFSYGISSDSESGKVLRYEINIDFLKQCLDQHVTEGAMTQAEADRVLEQARSLAGNSKRLVWSFQGDSGLVQDSFDENGNYRPGFNIFYKDEDGKLTPLDPATVVSGFILPAAEENGWAEVVVYRGRAYNRAGLSAETLEWLDWYLALPEEERLAVSYEPAELRDGDTPAGTGAEQAVPEVVPDYDPSTQDSAKAGDEPAVGEMGSSFYNNTIVGMDENGYPVDEQGNRLIFDDSGKLFMKVRSGYAPCVRMDCDISQEHHHEGAKVVYHYDTLPAELPVCPVEGCDIPVCHDHDGVTYYCDGTAHSGGVCDGSCRGWSLAVWNGADTAPTAAPVSSGHHGDSHHGNGYHGGHH